MEYYRIILKQIPFWKIQNQQYSNFNDDLLKCKTVHVLSIRKWHKQIYQLHPTNFCIDWSERLRTRAALTELAEPFPPCHFTHGIQKQKRWDLCSCSFPPYFVQFKYGIRILVGGIPTSLKNMKVSWDDEIPNKYIYIYGKIKNVPNHQPEHIRARFLTIPSFDLHQNFMVNHGQSLLIIISPLEFATHHHCWVAPKSRAA